MWWNYSEEYKTEWTFEGKRNWIYPKYGRRSMTLRDQKSAYSGMRKEVVDLRQAGWHRRLIYILSQQLITTGTGFFIAIGFTNRP